MTHVCPFACRFLAGFRSGILSRLTGCVLMNSLAMSKTKDLGASVLMEPAEACDRDNLYPAFSSAFLSSHVS